jgi:hypothetical protein
MFSNTLSFLSSRNVSDQVSHPYKTIGKTIVLYILFFKVLDSNLEDKSHLAHTAQLKSLMWLSQQVAIILVSVNQLVLLWRRTFKYYVLDVRFQRLKKCIFS